jgi:hypothetical protein
MKQGYSMVRVEIDARTLERLKAVNDQLDTILDRGRLLTSNVISLLLDHWQSGSPPSREWIKNQGGLYPGFSRRSGR